MFTVKWMYEHEGLCIDRIFAAEEVQVAFPNGRQPAASVDGRDVPPQGLVVLDPWDLRGRSIDSGKVYVMNDKGATVGNYDLDPKVASAPKPVKMGHV